MNGEQSDERSNKVVLVGVDWLVLIETTVLIAIDSPDKTISLLNV